MTDKDKDFVDFHLLLAQAKANIPLMTEWHSIEPTTKQAVMFEIRG
jgi:hypothetical protein